MAMTKGSRRSLAVLRRKLQTANHTQFPAVGERLLGGKIMMIGVLVRRDQLLGSCSGSNHT
jgi:hypothetical protein